MQKSANATKLFCLKTFLVYSILITNKSILLYVDVVTLIKTYLFIVLPNTFMRMWLIANGKDVCIQQTEQGLHY